MIVTAISIFLGAFLLFLVQPLTARRLLPWFGGSPAVWIVCLLFFQSVLLGGYAYAHGLTRRWGRKKQSLVHLALLLLALAFLPIGPRSLVEVTHEPTADLLWMLARNLGLPILLLASTSPLLQSWASSSDRVYRLFAVSNLGSLLGLWCYPFLLEPFSSVSTQARLWSLGFVAFVLATAVPALVGWRRPAAAPETPTPATRPDLWKRGLWLLLAATGSMLLMGTSNQLTRNVAAVPFLWVLPLSLYLLSFIIAFERARWYVRWVWGSLFLASLLGILQLLSLPHEPDLLLQVAIYSINLLAGGVICHGELYRMRPAVGALTDFYLTVALGGALGGVFVSVLAPAVFRGYWEYPLALGLVYAVGGGLTLGRSEELRPRVLWAVGGVVLLGLLGSYIRAESAGVLTMRRSFFGVLRVYERHKGTRLWERDLWNGPVAHGAQLLAPERRREPILYYSPETGVGLALTHLERECPGGRKIGVVGLGTGSLAAYAQAGDVLRFYEVNPDVVDVAREYFYYLEDTNASVETVVGDGRLSLARELDRDGSQQFDLLVLDAFSGDAIPLHLLTREAFALYEKHLAPDGILAVHVSNLHFDLRPVVRSHAESLGLVPVLVESDADPERNLFVSDWVLVTRNASFIASPQLQSRMTPWRADTGYRPEDYDWTDDYGNLFRVLK